MKLFKYVSIVGALVLSVITMGCHSQNSQFFILNPAQFSSIQGHHSCRQTIVIEDVRIPKYLDKPQMVTRASPNQLVEDEFHRWAEPLDSNISAVVKQNLSLQLKRDLVLSYPLLGIQRVNYYLAIKIKQFEVNSAGASILNASWSVYDGNKKLIIYRNSSYRSYAKDPKNYANIAFVMNQNLSELSRDIAYQLKRLGCH